MRRNELGILLKQLHNPCSGAIGTYRNLFLKKKETLFSAGGFLMKEFSFQNEVEKDIQSVDNHELICIVTQKYQI